MIAINSQKANAQTNPGKWLDEPDLPDIAYSYFSRPMPLYANDAKEFDRATLAVGNLDELATLGRILFYDRNLSANKLVSCASCHDQNAGFDDHSQFSIGFRGKITQRNSMGLSYIRFNQNDRYFWDESAEGLRAAVLRPFTNQTEMGLRKGELLARIASKPYYERLYLSVFGNDVITREKTGDALIAFISAMALFNSEYDQARAQVEDPRQNFPLFSTKQNRGKFLFFNDHKSGGADCIFCHQTEAFIAAPVASNIGLDAASPTDVGIGANTKTPGDIAKFRVPSLRNIAKRSPFMHDGRFSNLEQVIQHYSTGVKAHRNLAPQLKNADGRPRELDLSETDMQALVAFLETLSDKSLGHDVRFSNPFHKRSSD